MHFCSPGIDFGIFADCPPPQHLGPHFFGWDTPRARWPLLSASRCPSAMSPGNEVRRIIIWSSEDLLGLKSRWFIRGVVEWTYYQMRTNIYIYIVNIVGITIQMNKNAQQFSDRHVSKSVPSRESTWRGDVPIFSTAKPTCLTCSDTCVAGGVHMFIYLRFLFSIFVQSRR